MTTRLVVRVQYLWSCGQWVTARKTRRAHIRRRAVPLVEFYWLISGCYPWERLRINTFIRRESEPR